MSIIERKQTKSIREWLASDSLREQVAHALPKHMSADRMMRVAMTALTRIPKLAECEQASFMRCLLDLSAFGLEPDGRRAHLIPFENRSRGVVECQLILDYKGLVELAYRSGAVKMIHADVVDSRDVFEYSCGRILKHTPWFLRPDKPSGNGEIIAAYALAEFGDGLSKCEVLSRDDIERVRSRSKAAKSGPWVTDWQEMAKKTAFRRLSKWLPLSAEIRDAFDREDEDVLPARPVPQVSLDDLTARLEQSVPGEPMAEFRRLVAAAEDITAVRAAYDATFGPESALEWTAEDAAEGTRIRDAREAEIRASRGGKS